MIIRKLHTLLLTAFCVGLTACSDDDDFNANASAPVVKFPYEQLDIDLNQADNLPVVAVIQSEAGLKEVKMKLRKTAGIEDYKTVTEFFNAKSFSLSETPNYTADCEAFIVEAIDRFNRTSCDTLAFAITDVMGKPEVVFSPEEIVYDEMAADPVMPRTTFKVTAEAGLKQIEMFLVTAEGQENYGGGPVSFNGETTFDFDEMVNYQENSRGFKVKVTDLYDNVKIVTLKVTYKVAPAPVITLQADEIHADRNETKAIPMHIESVRGVQSVKLYRIAEGREEEVVNERMNGENTLDLAPEVLFTDATSAIKVIVDDGRKQTEATVRAYVGMEYAVLQMGSQNLANKPHDKYPDVYGLLSLNDLTTYSVDYALAGADNAANVDFMFYCFGGSAVPRLYAMDDGSKAGEFHGSGGKTVANLPVKNKTRFLKLTNFDFDKATAASIAKDIVASNIKSTAINPFEVGDVIAFKTGGTSSAGGNRIGVMKIVSMTDTGALSSKDKTQRVMTVAIKFPKP